MLFDVEDGEGGEEISIEADADTEVGPGKTATDPGRPTDKQIEEHRATHLPYKSWCRWCVLGRGRGLQHRACTTSLIPAIGMDYFFLTSAGVVPKAELKMDDEHLNAARQRARSRNARSSDVTPRSQSSATSSLAKAWMRTV